MTGRKDRTYLTFLLASVDVALQDYTKYAADFFVALALISGAGAGRPE